MNGKHCDVGCTPICVVCDRRKKPVGRSAAPAMAGDLCTRECDGYWHDPDPCDLWPGEEREPKEPA